jgi:type I restriction enzyme, S subunit
VSEHIRVPFAEINNASGNGINPFEFPDEEFELYSVPAHETGRPEITVGAAIGSNKQLVSEGMVLLCKINPRINRVWVVNPASGRRQIASTEWIAFERSAFIAPDYLANFLRQTAVRDFLAANASGVGGSLMRVKPSTLAAYEFTLTGLRAQTRIVAKLEELLSDLDAGVSELKAAQKKLGQYRQSLLKAAVEGALSAEWRKQHTPAETGAQLLQRILTERRARWEAKQLAKFKEQGKTPPKDWQKKYPEPVQPDTTDLPELPEGWVWASLGQITEFITSGSRGWADYYSDAGALFIRSQNINEDWLDLADIAFVNPPRNSEGARTRVKMHDLLLTITGANVGKAARVNIELEEAYVSQHVALIRPAEKMLADFLHLFLTASAGGRGLLDRKAYGAGKPGLNLQQIGAVIIPLTSSDEIQALMDIVAGYLKATFEQQRAIVHCLKRSTAQRQNILRAAFSGRLVPQDPNDEPASVLLARIRAERTARDAAKVPRRRKIKEAHGRAVEQL